MTVVVAMTPVSVSTRVRTRVVDGAVGVGVHQLRAYDFEIGPDPEAVLPGTDLENVVTTRREVAVVAVPAEEDIVTRGTGKDVVEGRTDHAFDIDEPIVSLAAADELHRDAVGQGQIDHQAARGAAVIDEVDSVAAVEQVVAAITGQRVVAGAALEHEAVVGSDRRERIQMDGDGIVARAALELGHVAGHGSGTGAERDVDGVVAAAARRVDDVSVYGVGRIAEDGNRNHVTSERAVGGNRVAHDRVIGSLQGQFEQVVAVVADQEDVVEEGDVAAGQPNIRIEIDHLDRRTAAAAVGVVVKRPVVGS